MNRTFTRSELAARDATQRRMAEVGDILAGEKPGMEGGALIWVAAATIAVTIALCLWGPEIHAWVTRAWDWRVTP